MADNALAPPLDLSHHFSYTTKNREQSSVKKFYKYYQIPGIHNLAGGERRGPCLESGTDDHARHTGS